MRDARRHDVDAEGSAGDLIDAWAAAASSVGAAAGARWGVAMPDPFDYTRGVALFDAGVAKFGTLHGVDVGSALCSSITPAPASLAFLNDADAFALGEWTSGVAAGARRVTGLTLGTGVGTGWLVDGAVTDPGTPPAGRLHRMAVRGVPIEDVMSRRAIRRAFVAAGGPPGTDVREIAGLARGADPRATDVLAAALGALGSVMAGCLAAFSADLLVVGGSMSASWDLFEPWFRDGARAPLPEIRVAARPEAAPLVGAAAHALR